MADVPQTGSVFSMVNSYEACDFAAVAALSSFTNLPSSTFDVGNGTLAAGKSVLVWSGTAPGPYVLSANGSNWNLTRRADLDADAEVRNGATVAVRYGTSKRGQWCLIGATLSTIRFEQIAASQSPAFNSLELADADAAHSYTQTISVSGGAAPYTYRVDGELPRGLTIDAATGTISGVPIAPGTVTFDVSVTDLNGKQAKRTFAIRVWSYSQKLQELFGGDIVAHWKHDEFIGATVASDDGPNGHDATPTNVAFGYPGFGGDCAGHYTVSPISSLDVASAGFLAAFDPTEFTILQWFKPDSANFWTGSNAERLFAFINTDTSKYCQLFKVTNGLAAQYPTGGAAQLNVSGLSGGDWTLAGIAVSATADKFDVIINGALGNQSALSAQWSGVVTQFKFGNAQTPAGNTAFPGLIQHPIVINRRITLWESRQAYRVQAAGTWTPQGVVLEPNVAATENDYVGEPNVIVDGNPQILTGYGEVFKCWYSAGNDSDIYSIGYAESLDGKAWVKHSSNPVISGRTRASGAVRHGSRYYMTAMRPSGAGHVIDLLQSTNGISWEVVTLDVVTNDANEINFNNSQLIIEGNTWYIFYDFTPPGNTLAYRVGVTRSTDGGATWTKSANNPIFIGPGSDSARTFSGPWVFHSRTGKWYMWGQGHLSAVVPTDIFRAESSDPMTGWIDSIPGNVPAFERHSRSTGAFYTYGQVADVSMVERNGMIYMLYAALYTQSYQTHIELATAPLTLEQLVQTSEGISLSYNPEMLINPSFEYTAAGAGAASVRVWNQGASDGALARTTTAAEVHTSSSRIAAMKLTAGPNKQTEVDQTVTGLVPRATYVLTGWSRGNGSYAGRVKITTVGGTDLIPFGPSVGTTSATYAPFAFKFKAPLNGSVVVSLWCPDANGTFACFDDLSLTRQV